jgi:hypothetical protein
MTTSGADSRVPIVATHLRWIASSAAAAVALAVAVEAVVLFTHSARPLASFVEPIGIAALIASVLLFVLLRAEESRLTRELRMARTGTPVLRGLVAGRRQHLPFFARICSTKLGMAAVLLADGDRDAALDALATASGLMRWGRLEKLRAILDADLERSAGTSAGLERCVQQLRGMSSIGHREADLYRIHVLVKAVLAQGDGDVGLELAKELAGADRGKQADDDDARLYVTWLRVWFDLDQDAEGADADMPWPPLSDGDIRMATLVARSHGAERLVSKLEERLSAIARAEPQE